MKTTEWFSTWFDSPYYHILYKDRDDSEASFFLSNLLTYLNPLKGSFMLDLACGSGRHSNFLAKQGYNVLGVDLSFNSIVEARKYQQKNTSFFTMDMRERIDFLKFEYVFNLFTSFGYFDTDDENYKVIEAVKHCLNEEGIYVIDFFNAFKVIENLKENETKTVEGIDFNIKRAVVNKFVVKTISFNDAERNYLFKEKVRLFTIEDFEIFLKKAGFKVVDVFGNFSLENYNKQDSDRLILIAKLIN